MEAGGNFIQVTPFFPVRDMIVALPFYIDSLGFNLAADQGGYAYIERERAAIRLLQLDQNTQKPWPGPAHCYIDVRDVDAIATELAPCRAELGAERTGGPEDQAYGQRELWLRDPDGNLLTFGQGIGPNARQWDYRN